MSLASDQASSFDSNGVRIRYVTRGKGEPVILLHGFTFGMQAHWIASGWLEALSHDYRVIALDLRGHGQSGKPHDPQSYGVEMVNDVLRLMDHLKLAHAHVVGYSLGGILALKLTEVAPARLFSVVVGGAGAVRDGDAQHQAFRQAADMFDSVGPGQLISDRFWPDKSRRPPLEIQQVVDSNDAAALAAVARGMLTIKTTEDALRSNRVPILAVFGEHDPIKATGAAMEGVARNFRMLTLPGLDHNSLAPSEEFKRAIREFISQRGGTVRSE